ncbi:PAS domain-containing hybrid sensor histidine kinase/response regulator [Spirochaeta isovalerica]|uniref:histidine kinase n=1 Tax=Spirochaeta isovalerica TaxID=150 RepID=A0A841RHW5_9SPIO|nr:PAS domain-containing sensor histidine kinase [Spirochaeta isovalerica]MBB6482128.1 PAS domain S-box-containing protein [Spirochaeta isovalerica]
MIKKVILVNAEDSTASDSKLKDLLESNGYTVKKVKPGEEVETFQKETDSDVSQVLLSSRDFEQFRMYRKLIENSRDMLYRMSLPEGIYEYVSPASTEITGYTPEEFYNNPLLIERMIHPDWKNYLYKKMDELLAGKINRTYEYQIICKNNEMKWINQRNRLIKDNNGLPVAIEGLVTDVTERKNEEEKYRKLTETLQEGLWQLDKDSNTVYVNSKMAEILGYSINEMLGRHLFSFMDEKGVEYATELLARRKRGLQDQHDFEFMKKNGERVYLLLETTPVFDQKGNYNGALASVIDITKRKEAEKALRESEERFKALHNASFGGITIHDKGIILECNQGLSQITGYTYEELIGMNGLLLIAEETRDLVLKNINSGYEKAYEAIGVRKSGEKYPIRLEARQVPYKGKNVRVVEFRDITDKKKTEFELLKMEKLRSLGDLAGGIAHDFNNLLTGIYSNVSIALLKLDKNHPAYTYLLKTEESIERSRKLTGQLLTFAKGGQPVKKKTDLVKLIKETVLFDLSGSNLQPVFTYSEKESIAEVDIGQIEQVISNLVINAKQATPGGGSLFVSIERCIIGEDDIPELQPGDYWKISIKDEGTGIPFKYLDKIFDPYFTTKEAGHGLGLATIYSIIKKHDGHIEVSSEVGRGTSFSFYLPSLGQSHAAEEDKTGSTEMVPEKNVRVLIMDDDEIIRETLSETIALLGHETEVAADGDEAIAKYKEAFARNRPYEIIIMDLTIPGGMGGKEALIEIQKINENAKVIVSSGYSASQELADYEALGFIDIIEKPYTMSRIKDVLNRVLPL